MVIPIISGILPDNNRQSSVKPFLTCFGNCAITAFFLDGHGTFCGRLSELSRNIFTQLCMCTSQSMRTVLWMAAGRQGPVALLTQGKQFREGFSCFYDGITARPRPREAEELPFAPVVVPVWFARVKDGANFSDITQILSALAHSHLCK